MLYLPITKTWIISKSAKTLYFICALLSFSLFGALFAIAFAMAFSGIHSLYAFPTALKIAQGVLFPGVLGTATLSIAMWYFWFTFDQSSWLRKACWFLPLYGFLPLGPALYFFFVYRRSSDVRSLSAAGAAHYMQPLSNSSSTQ